MGSPSSGLWSTPCPVLAEAHIHTSSEPVTMPCGSYHPPPLPSVVPASVSSLPPTPCIATLKSIVCTAVQVAILKGSP